jgi:uncharacterized protein YcbK (DUF882 family)
MSDRPSLHLTWDELACKDGTPYPDAWREDRLPPLLDAFERIRERVGGQPIILSSAYRTPAHNAKIGGVSLSQHVQGRALDLLCPAGVPLRAFWSIVQDVARLSPLRGLGLYDGGWVHIDTRPSNIIHLWHNKPGGVEA